MTENKMKAFNITFGLIIMVSTMVISYWHSFDLFHSSIAYQGFHGVFAHLGVVVVESMFALSTLNIVVSVMNGRQPAGPAKIGFYIGTAFVGWSNVSAAVEPEVMEIIYSFIPPVALATVKGILLGGIPPTALSVGLMILMRAILEPVQVGETTQQVGEVQEQVEESPIDTGKPSPTMGGISQGVGEVQEQIEEPPTEEDKPTYKSTRQGDSQEESPTEGKENAQQEGENNPMGDHPKRRRFTQGEIESMAAQIYQAGESPSKREIMTSFRITDHYAKKVMNALKELKEQRGEMENEKDSKPARIEGPAHGKQSHRDYITEPGDYASEKEEKTQHQQVV